MNFQELPKYPKFRPDFQAPGPRVLIEKDINFEEEESKSTQDEDNEVDEVESYGPSKLRYYESQKVLGKLYREIDEQVFFEQIQKQSRASTLNPSKTQSLADAVWAYVSQKTVLIQWQHYMQFAEDVRDR